MPRNAQAYQDRARFSEYRWGLPLLCLCFLSFPFSGKQVCSTLPYTLRSIFFDAYLMPGTHEGGKGRSSAATLIG